MSELSSVREATPMPDLIPEGRLTVVTGNPDCVTEVVEDIMARATIGDWRTYGQTEQQPRLRALMAISLDSKRPIHVRAISRDAEVAFTLAEIGYVEHAGMRLRSREEALAAFSQVRECFGTELVCISNLNDLALALGDEESDLPYLVQTLCEAAAVGGIVIITGMGSNPDADLGYLAQTSAHHLHIPVAPITQDPVVTCVASGQTWQGESLARYGPIRTWDQAAQNNEEVQERYLRLARHVLGE